MLRVFYREGAEWCKASIDRHLNLPPSSGSDKCEDPCGLKSVIMLRVLSFALQIRVVPPCYGPYCKAGLFYFLKNWSGLCG